MLNNSIAFKKAQIKTSIDIPDYMHTYNSIKLETKMAQDAASNLFKEYPRLIETKL